MVTLEGNLYTLGTGEQGQLGRVAEIFSNRGGRQGLGKSSGKTSGPTGSLPDTLDPYSRRLLRLVCV